MNHLIPIPIIIISVIILIVCKQYKVKPFVFIAKVVIAISTIYFIYEFVKYLGFDMLSIFDYLF